MYRYLKEIYRAYEEGIPLVGPTQISKALNVSKSTAHHMLKNMASMGYGIYMERKGFMLNEKGMEMARRIMRKHRIIESFLVSTFSMSACQACEEADRIDGCIGDDVVKMMEKRFNYTKCPCGKEIPK